ncbi:MAG: hypothetical protein WEC80_00325 [Patescibacteria group bacterium]
MTREIIHSLIMVVAIALTFIFPKTPLAQFDIQIIAILFIILFAGKKFLKISRLLESLIFTLVIFIIINTTGGASSPFFFLIYFLMFSLALILEPVISIVMTLTSVIFFMIFLPQQQSINSLLPIFALVFLTPFALYMGREHIKNESLKVKNQSLQKDTFLFHSLILKNHLKNIKNSIENFMGDHELSEIKNSTMEMEKLMEKFDDLENKNEQ